MNFSQYAALYVGTRQGDKRHKKIIDGYNNIRPLPRGVRMTYHYAWCAAFVSFVLSENNAISAPYECSVYYMWKKAKDTKQTVKTPKVNDIIVYNWNGDSVPDHVGIISKIDGDILTVIEGNYNKAVGVRTISKTSKKIFGYIRVKQAVIKNDIDNVAREVIAGKYGNGEERKKTLTAAGYNYEEVQNKVNELLK